MGAFDLERRGSGSGRSSGMRKVVVRDDAFAHDGNYTLQRQTLERWR